MSLFFLSNRARIADPEKLKLLENAKNFRQHQAQNLIILVAQIGGGGGGRRTGLTPSLAMPGPLLVHLHTNLFARARGANRGRLHSKANDVANYSGWTRGLGPRERLREWSPPRSRGLTSRSSALYTYARR